uniref:WGS project CBME000000000 data, contig CS3487_c000752 n=1 Tax=Fusarium pseudograminearum CS3487 TaxID=1318458 RepID=A0A096PDJ6_FUSPS|nr:unnamed protein product [Fusarium pseudograminearum CS3487]
MSCRLPGDATDTQKLWELITKCHSAWSKVPTDRWNQEAFHDRAAKGKPGRTSKDAGHFLKDDIKAFDVSFFGVNSIEATVYVYSLVPWRDYIVNPQTMRLIEQMVCSNAHRYPFKVAKEDDMFFALVASDNGLSIALMLRDYPWIFGFKMIVGTFIVPLYYPSLYWRLKEVMTDVVPDTPDPPILPFASKKDKRKFAKRMSQYLSEG